MLILSPQESMENLIIRVYHHLVEHPANISRVLNFIPALCCWYNLAPSLDDHSRRDHRDLYRKNQTRAWLFCSFPEWKLLGVACTILAYRDWRFPVVLWRRSLHRLTSSPTNSRQSFSVLKQFLCTGHSLQGNVVMTSFRRSSFSPWHFDLYSSVHQCSPG